MLRVQSKNNQNQSKMNVYINNEIAIPIATNIVAIITPLAL